MTRFDPNKIRLFVPDDLSAGASLSLSRDHAHYLGTVMRRSSGDAVHLFNGQDGEWRADIQRIDRKKGAVTLVDQTLPQRDCSPLTLAFAPLKRSAMDFVAQKATELGVSDLRPVLTDRTTTRKVNQDRMAATCIEAAEQCERLDIPKIHDVVSLQDLVHDVLKGQTVIYCDEGGDIPPMKTALEGLQPGNDCTILVGPEGGFSAAERQQLQAMDNIVPVSLGPRIMRADTAAIAALTLYQAIQGDL